jgi:hypothetical protein
MRKKVIVDRAAQSLHDSHFPGLPVAKKAKGESNKKQPQSTSIASRCKRRRLDNHVSSLPDGLKRWVDLVIVPILIAEFHQRRTCTTE